MCRLQAKLEIPFRADEYLTAIAPIDDGPIAALILDAGTPAAAAITAAHVAGPKVAQALMNEVAAAGAAVANAAQPDKQAASERLREWGDRLAATPEASFVTALASCDAAAGPPVIAAIADAVGRHGSRDQDKPPLNVGGEAARIDMLMKAWSAALVGSPNSSRGQLWHLAIAIGRLARTELLEPLKQLRDDEARRHQEAREKVRAMGRQAASIELRSDASTGYSLQYRDAFARMGAAAAPLMIDYLTDLEFGFDAACALKSIYDRTNGVEKPSVFKSWPHLADAAARRAAGPLQGDTTYADAIFAAVEVLTGATSTPEQQALAIMIARMALGMPCRDQANLIARLLALPRAIRHKRELVAALVMAGHSFDADLGLAAIAERIEDAKQNTWRFRDSLWEVVGWLELLPFSNRPASVLDGIQMLVDVQPTRERMERVVLAAGEAPDLGDDRIAEMFRRFPWLASEHEWADAVFARGTVASALTIINLVKEGRLGTARGGLDHWWLAQRLAPLARRTPAIKAEILKAYQDTVGSAHPMLERTLEELGGDDCVLALVHGYARAGKRFDGSLHQALQHTAVDQQRIGDSNTYNLHPVSIAPLRKKLFELMHGTDATVAVLSQECLMNIDDIRDHIGAVETEPRHPDVATGKPWPPEADRAA